MHINDAKEFLETALSGFLQRNFSSDELEVPTLMEMSLSVYLDFVSDPCPYWVREKTLFVLDSQNQYEFEILRKAVPPTPRKALNAIVRKAAGNLERIIEPKVSVSGNMAIYLPPPRLRNSREK